MGHKVSPIAWRIGYSKTWSSTGYYDKADYSAGVTLDVMIRDFIQKELTGLPIGNIYITHSDTGLRIAIHTSRVSLVLGKSGENIDSLQKKIETKFQSKASIDVKEIKNPDAHAVIIADSIARQIERRLPYRRVIKQAIQRAMEKGAKGIKVIVAGRINGVDIARRETYKEGNIPTQTIRSNIDYTTERANTMYGVIGIKVWVYKGDIKK